MTLGDVKDQDIKVKMSLYYSGVLASADKVLMGKYLDAYSLPTDQRRQRIRLHGSNNQIPGHFDHIAPIISQITEWNRLSSSDQHKKEGDAANNDAKISSIEIIFRDSDNNHQEVKMAIGLSTPLKNLFNDYSDERGESLRSLRFSFKGKTLFLSSAGHLTPEELGMKNLDLISVSAFVGSPSRNNENEPKDISSHKSLLRRKKKSSGAKGNTRKQRSSPRTVAVEDYTEFMVRHSLALTKLFDEVDAKFKEIRQELNTLNIERTQPKAKSSHKKSADTPPDQPINHPPMDGIGGKAGKTSFAVLVGGSDNVYNTSKPSARRNHALSVPHPIVLDLHGLTRDQALAKLDDRLPEWTDIAMQGCHPFVQPVVIVCGGGNQILSESVEHLIRHDDGGSNAPKNMFVH